MTALSQSNGCIVHQFITARYLSLEEIKQAIACPQDCTESGEESDNQSVTLALHGDLEMTNELGIGPDSSGSPSDSDSDFVDSLVDQTKSASNMAGKVSLLLGLGVPLLLMKMKKETSRADRIGNTLWYVMFR